MRRVWFGVLTVCALVLAAPAVPARADMTGPPRVSIGSGSVVEGQMTRRYIRFTVSLSWPTNSVVTVHVATADGSATTADHDYVAKSTTLTFKAKQTAKYVSVLVWPDTEIEGDETFSVNLSGETNASAGLSTGTGTIIDDDPNVGSRVGIGDATVPESCAGNPVSAALVVTLSHGASEPFVVQVTTAPDTAVSPGDFKAVSKTLTFTSGQILKEIRIPVYADQVVEGDQQFEVSISVVSGGPFLVGKGVGTVTIADCTP